MATTRQLEWHDHYRYPTIKVGVYSGPDLFVETRCEPNGANYLTVMRRPDGPPVEGYMAWVGPANREP